MIYLVINKIKYIFILLILFLFYSLSHAGLILYDNCEDQWSSDDWGTAGVGGGNTISVSSVQYRAGGHSYRFVLQPYGSGAQTNVELLLRAVRDSGGHTNFTIGNEYWLGYSIFIPQKYNLESFWTSPQFHLISGDCNSTIHGPNWGFFVSPGTGSWNYNISLGGCDAGGGGHRDSSAISNSNVIYGSWHDYVYNFKFHYNGSQFVKMWVDGNYQGQSTSINCGPDSKGPYMKLGVYAHPSQVITIYFDEIRIADSDGNYSMVAPGGGSAPPDDTIAPTISDLYPSGTKPSGTTSVEFGCATDESATCRQSDNISDAWGDMAEMNTTGGISHSETASGLSDGNTYYRYIICRDSSSNESNKATISWSVDVSQGGSETNLFNDDTIYSYTCDDPEDSWDTYTDDYGPHVSEEQDNSSELIFDLHALYENMKFRVFGDDVGTRVSKTISIYYKVDSVDSWTTFISGSNIYGSQWYEFTLTGIQARFIRVVITSDTGITQWRELELTGTIVSEADPIPTNISTRRNVNGPNVSYSADGVRIIHR